MVKPNDVDPLLVQLVIVYNIRTLCHEYYDSFGRSNFYCSQLSFLDS